MLRREPWSAQGMTVINVKDMNGSSRAAMICSRVSTSIAMVKSIANPPATLANPLTTRYVGTEQRSHD